MTIKQIIKLQKQYGYTEIQQLINSGRAWILEGSYGRAAMACLKNGECFLPLTSFKDYYGNHVPSRKELKPDTMGTLGNSQIFWEAVESGEISLDVYA